jgi:hypothetical protein
MEEWKDGRVEEGKDGRGEGWKGGRGEGWKRGRVEGGEGWKSVNHQVVLLFKHSMWFIFCGVLLTLSQMVWADGGAIQFQGDSGAFHATVFTQPPILRAGFVDVTLLLQDRSSLNPLLDAKVTFDLTAQDSNKAPQTAWMPPACAMYKTVNLSNVLAKLGHGENRLLYGAVVQIPGNGHWLLKAHIQRDTQRTELETLLDVKPALLPPLAYWHLFLLPPLGILGFVLHQMARGQRRREEGVRKLSSRSE